MAIFLKIIGIVLSRFDKILSGWDKWKKRRYESGTKKDVRSHSTDSVNDRVRTINRKRQARRDGA